MGPLPQLDHVLAPGRFDFAAGQPRTRQQRRHTGQLAQRRPPIVHHHRLQLGGDGCVDARRGAQCDQTGPGPLGGARRQHGGPVIAPRTGQDEQVPETALVRRHRARRGVAGEILGQAPPELARAGTARQADVALDFQPARVLPRRQVAAGRLSGPRR
ncbi:MAG: hypothetical protein M5U12_01330 [Verrucomicrobia bacterium]|nr:hypothetical protein [Verrucomicrobiota bacterium]